MFDVGLPPGVKPVGNLFSIKAIFYIQRLIQKVK